MEAILLPEVLVYRIRHPRRLAPVDDHILIGNILIIKQPCALPLHALPYPRPPQKPHNPHPDCHNSNQPTNQSMSVLIHISTCIIIFTLSAAFYSVTPKITTNGYTFFIRLSCHKNIYLYLFIYPFISPFKILLFSNICTNIMFISSFLFALLLALSNFTFLLQFLHSNTLLSVCFYAILDRFILQYYT